MDEKKKPTEEGEGDSSSEKSIFEGGILWDPVRAFTSFGIRLQDSKTQTVYCANLIIQGTWLPVTARLSDWLGKHGGGQFIAGQKGEMIEELPLVVLENYSWDDTFPVEDCSDLYKSPIAFDGPILDTTPIDIEMTQGVDGEITLTLIEVETGKRHPMHLKRKHELSQSELEELNSLKLG